jgi:ABC-type amino acid transport substrate-binding protein
MRKIVLLFALLCLTAPALADAPKETAYDRVMRTGTLRCGYLVYTPNFVKDANTGAISGIFADAMGQAGKLLSLNIEWAEEAGLAGLIEGLHTGRIDAICSGLWANAARGRETEASIPLFYNALNVYVRTRDKRFDNNFSALNDSGVRIAVIDGEMADQIANADFPKAKKVSLPQMTDFSLLLLQVSTGKADATIAGAHEGPAFLKANPGTIRQVASAAPIRVFPNVLFFDKGQMSLKTMIDSAIGEMQSSGTLDRIIAHYESYAGSFYRVAPPYGEPK